MLSITLSLTIIYVYQNKRDFLLMYSVLCFKANFNGCKNTHKVTPKRSTLLFGLNNYKTINRLNEISFPRTSALKILQGFNQLFNSYGFTDKQVGSKVPTSASCPWLAENRWYRKNLTTIFSISFILKTLSILLRFYNWFYP